MKNYTYNKMIGWLFACLLFNSFAGCDSFVEVDVPDTQLAGGSVFENVGTAEAAMVNIYAKMRNNGLVSGEQNGMSILLGNYADELVCYSNEQVEIDFYQNGLLAANATVTDLWNNTYNLIHNANAVYEGVDRAVGISSNDKEQLMGEALFTRAYLQFHLLNLFGSIPYITTTDYRVNTVVNRMAAEQVFPLIIADLEQAKLLLSDEYITGERVRPNKSVAAFLLARAHLYTGNWAAAKLEADTVIANGSYVWNDNLDTVFLKGSTGTIWQLMPPAIGVNTAEARNFIFETGPPPLRALSSTLISAFEAGDQRKEKWIGTVTNDAETWYFAHKYKLNNATGTAEEYSILMRLEEIFLIRAEANTHLGNMDAAKSDMNKLRDRAGLPNTVASNTEELLAAILKERQTELFTEQGHRWFDLKRTGKSDQVLGVTKTGWNSDDILWPVPENELLLNPNLQPQNAGY